MEKIVNSLSPNEKKILPYIQEEISEICKKTDLDKVAVLRSLEYLQNKGIVKLDYQKKKIIGLGINGILYKRKGLPERRLLQLLDEKRIIPLQEAQKQSSLSNDEFKASLGALKKKALIELKNGKIILKADKTEVAKKMLEESFLEILPINENKLKPEQKLALSTLQKRKNLIEKKEDTLISVEVTDLGKNILKLKIKNQSLMEQITPEIIKNWKGKKFRRYDVTSPLPKIKGGKRHFVNQAIDYARKIWLEMGFEEMHGKIIQPSFWNFDALFTAQDHPVREMQDTFFINEKKEIKDKKLIRKIKEAHEKGLSGSKGWGYEWDEELSKKLVLRTHTTCLSAQTLYNLKKFPAKFFAIGKSFRNETVDWTHGFEFNQTEGIVVDPNVNFRHLLGYLKQFAKKMGYDKIRFRPAYFPYTEPSLEGDVWDEEKKEWVELIAGGIFRPEVTEPLLGKPIPVLAWGPGFDRMIMKIYNIRDLRNMYKNNLTELRKVKFWTKQ